MTSVEPRPRSVDVAFWAWTLAGIVLVLFGMWLITNRAPMFVHGVGFILMIVGFAQAYLGSRTRAGDRRFRRAAIALALTFCVLLIVLTFLTLGPLWLVPMILLMVGAYGASRPSADQWFDAIETGTDDG
jgi:D-alanyl-lipoteichoic acid acyltransferase DltB (MBOAT superfamily)